MRRGLRAFMGMLRLDLAATLQATIWHPSNWDLFKVLKGIILVVSSTEEAVATALSGGIQTSVESIMDVKRWHTSFGTYPNPCLAKHQILLRGIPLELCEKGRIRK